MNKGKIIIATWYGPANYGTALQAFALKHYLESLGYEVSFLEDNREDVDICKLEEKKSLILKVKKLFTATFWRKLPYKYALKKKAKLQNNFIVQHTKTASIKSITDVRKINQCFDIFISGGDQIWNPYVTNTGFMLDFVEDGKIKISYGTSVGVSDIPEFYIDMYKKNLLNYHAISVREKQSMQALQAFLKRDIEVVLDPVLLFSGEEWYCLLKDANIESKRFDKPYILVYFVGTRLDYWDYVRKIKRDTGYQVVVVPINDEAYLNNFRKYTEVSPAEFLWLIKNAAIICTDSFHATVFSILYCKEFYTLKRFLDSSREGQNGRLVDLLSRYGLINRLITDESSFYRKAEIDYVPIFQRIEQERIYSRQWLENAISK